MEKWVLIFPLFMAFLAKTASSDPSEKKETWMLINCGWEKLESYDGWLWVPDNDYISTGKSIFLVPNVNIPDYMNSLRYFPDGGKNCYNLSPDPQYKFLFRAGFYYGNYDFLSKPPTFDLLIDGGFWATVNTSTSDQEPVYYEILYKPKANDKNTTVCLVQTRQGEVPFISSLVMVYLHLDNGTNSAKSLYKLMGNDTALRLVSRSTFGGLNKVISGWSNPAWSDSWSPCDYTLRIWQPKPMPGYLNISFVHDYHGFGCLGSSYENEPPDSLLLNAITPANAIDSIFLDVDFRNKTGQSAYFVFYFLDYKLNLSQNSNNTRKFEIHIDGALKSVVELNGIEFGQVVTLYPVEVSGTANVTISPFNGSVLPPVLNGIEVYTASEISMNIGFKLRCSGVSMLFIYVIYLLVLLV